DYTVTCGDFSTAGVKIVTITSKIDTKVKCNFYVYVKDAQNSEIKKPEITDITIKSLETAKTAYRVGEKLDLSGFQVSGTYDGFEINLPYTSEPANGAVLTAENTQITFYYNGGTLTQTISVTQPYTVTFKDGDKIVYTLEVAAGESLEFPVEPQRENYTFGGWYNGETKVTAGQTINGNLELTAKWEANGYTIKYELNGGTNDQSNPKNYNVESETITLAAATKTGYTFGGWYKDENFSGEKITKIAKGSTGNITLYAQWTANTYTVIFNANVDDSSVTETMANQTFTYDVEQTLTKNAFTREGYTFAGWATSASGNAAYTNMAKVKNLTAEDKATFTLYAVWTEKNKVLPVIFSVESGTPVDYNDSVTLSCETEGAKISYTIDGVTAEYTNAITITKNVTITAFATKDGMKNSDTTTASYTVKTYTVTYKSDYDTAPSKIVGLKKGDKLTAEQLPVLTTDGYTFAGWYNGENEVTTEYNIIGDLNLTAKWTPNTYTVIFNANVNDNSVAGTMANQSFTYDVVQALTRNAFTRVGYTFAGWAT
ncbi:MAG: InlB B-repeat-containing protein, partial [Spirochaetota bacterium]|nr:InlB B-repeat-containing protein [Spirochaetota bacterium]